MDKRDGIAAPLLRRRHALGDSAILPRNMTGGDSADSRKCLREKLSGAVRHYHKFDLGLRGQWRGCEMEGGLRLRVANPRGVTHCRDGSLVGCVANSTTRKKLSYYTTHIYLFLPIYYCVPDIERMHITEFYYINCTGQTTTFTSHINDV